MNKPTNKSSILVVDDAPDTLEIVKRNLTSHGYEVFTVNSVDNAIERTEKRKLGEVLGIDTGLKELNRITRQTMTEFRFFILLGTEVNFNIKVLQK